MLKISALTVSAVLAASAAFASSDSRPTQLEVSAQDRTQSEVTSALQGLGYERIHDARMSGDIYTATVSYGDKWYNIRIDDEIGYIDAREERHRDYIPSNADMTKEAVASELADLGYTNLRDMEKNGSIFRGKGDRDGSTSLLVVDTETGIVTGLEERTQETIGNAQAMSDGQIVRALGGLGYMNGKNVQREGNVISVKAMRDGKPVDLNIDARNGAVTVVN